HRAAFRAPESPRLHLPPVHQRQRQPVREHRPQLFNQIQRQPRTPRPVPMQVSNRRIESHCLQRRRHVVRQQRVYEGKQRVHVVQRRPPAPSTKKEIFLGGGDQLIEHAEIHACRVSLVTRISSTLAVLSTISARRESRSAANSSSFVSLP